MGSLRPRGPRTGIAIDTAALRRAREEAGLSLAQVAGADLTRQAVHLIEAGKVRPSLRSLRLIAKRLGVPESTLLVPPGPGSDQQLIADLEQLVQRQDYAQLLSRATALITPGGQPERLAYAHHYAGQALYLLGKPAEALVHLREAQRRFGPLANPWWVVESMDWEAMALHMLEDQTALRLGRAALRRYRALEPRQPETEARILEHLGSICFGRRDYAKARVWYEEALQVEGGIRELARMARIYHGLGMCRHGTGELRQAAELLFRSITLYEAEQRIAGTSMRMGLPMVENDLGLVVMAQGDLARAEELFRTALAHFEAAGIERLMSHTLLSLGELRLRQGRPDEGLEFTTQAIERADALAETYTLIGGYRQLGELHAARAEHELADMSFQRALAICEETGLDERAQECRRSYERVLAERAQAHPSGSTASA